MTALLSQTSRRVCTRRSCQFFAHRNNNGLIPRKQPQLSQIRSMGGGGSFMKVSERHTWWGEAFGVVCWLWVIHRARHDGPVILGWRHPWEHAHDPFAPSHHDDHHDAASIEAMRAGWDKFSAKAASPKEDDDDDDEDEEEEED